MNSRHRKPQAPARNNTNLQPVPANDPNNEANEIPDDFDPRVAYVRLTYDWSDHPGINPDRWQPHVLAFHRDASYAAIIDQITTYFNTKVQNQETALCTQLDQSNPPGCIVFQLALQSSDRVKQYASTLTSSGTSRIRALRDLCGADVRPLFDFVLRRKKDETRRIENPTQRVTVRPWASGDPSSEYYLIGSVTEDHSGDESLSEDAQSILTMDYFWKEIPVFPQPTTVLVRVPAWDLGASLVCDAGFESLVDTHTAIPVDFKLNKAYEEYLEVADLETFQDIRAAIPIRGPKGSINPYDFISGNVLTYDFQDVNDVHPNDHVLPQIAETPITFAVRFVQHLERPGETNVNFDQDLVCMIDGDFSHKHIKELVLKNLPGMQGEYAALCDPMEFELEWDVDLWVMHQSRKSLLRFKPESDIRQFLDLGTADDIDSRLLLEAHIIPLVSAPDDLPTDEESESVDDEQVIVRLTYDLEGERRLARLHGMSQDVQLSRDQDCGSLFTHLADFLTSALAHYAKEYHDDLERSSKKQFMLLRPILNDLCPVKKYAFAYEESGKPQVPTIGDLLNGTNEAGESQLDVKLELLDVRNRVRNTDPMVEIRPVKDPESARMRRFYCIGSVQMTSTQDQSISTSDTYFWRLGHTGITTVVAPTWTIRNFDICEPASGRTISDKSVRAIMHGRAVGTPLYPSNVQKDARDGLLLPSSGGRLKYSFKTFGVTKGCPRPVHQFPSGGISVAVRFVNHLEGKEASKLMFSSTIELELEENDKAAEILQAIQETVESIQADGKMRALYKPPLQDQWGVQFWVLPQVPGGTTLYRYKSSVQALHSFLNQTEVSQGDATLFMEVHLVPKRQASDDAGKKSGRATRTAQRTPFSEL